MDWETIKTDMKKLPKDSRPSIPENLQMLNLMVFWRTRFGCGALACSLVYNNTTASFP